MAVGFTSVFAVISVVTSQAFQHKRVAEHHRVETQQQQRPKSHSSGIGASRPGSPNTTAWEGDLPFIQVRPEALEYGARLLRAAHAPRDTLGGCHGFVSFGDFTWCSSVMPKESPGAKQGLYGPVSAGAPGVEKQPEMVGISFGIRDRDMWSELLSNRYNVPTQLYDCYWDEDKGPMGTKQLTRLAMNKTEGCPHWQDEGGQCYNTAYFPHKVCIDKTEQNIHTNGRVLKFEPLEKPLKDKKPLSVFMKIDIEGSEWDSLEWLLSSPSDIEKIRSLDMEAHMQYYKSGNKENGPAEMEKKVKIMEELSQYFVVVGSTVAAQHEEWEKKMRRMRKTSGPDAKMVEPLVYANDALYLQRYSISFVNRKLLPTSSLAYKTSSARGFRDPK